MPLARRAAPQRDSGELCALDEAGPDRCYLTYRGCGVAPASIDLHMSHNIEAVLHPSRIQGFRPAVQYV